MFWDRSKDNKRKDYDYYVLIVWQINDMDSGDSSTCITTNFPMLAHIEIYSPSKKFCFSKIQGIGDRAHDPLV